MLFGHVPIDPKAREPTQRAPNERGYIVVMVLAKIAGFNSITFFTIVEIFTIVNPVGFQTATALRDSHGSELTAWTA